MPAQRRYDQELRDRAVRLYQERRRDHGSESAQRSRQRENAELRRANDILKTASAFFAAAELDRRLS